MASRSATLEKKAAPVRKPSETAASAAPMKKVAATVTLKGVFERLAEDHNLPKKQVQALLDGMIEALTIHLKNGERVRMSGLGILEVKNRPSRQGRNPATGEAIQFAASKKVAFRAAKELKEAV